MRSVSNRNNSSSSVITSSTTGKNTNSSSGLSSSQLSNKNSSTSSASGTLNAAKIAQMRTSYTAIKKAADGLQTHADKLLATGNDSLFGKASPESTSSLTDAELTKNKDNLVKEISSLIDDYNTMVKNMKTAGGTLNNLYLKQVKGFATASQSALKEIGVKQKSDGTLSVTQKTMKSADTEDLQKVFGMKDSFAAKVSAKSATVESNAVTALKSLNGSNSSGYNKYGSLTDILASSGNRLNSKG